MQRLRKAEEKTKRNGAFRRIALAILFLIPSSPLPLFSSSHPTHPTPHAQETLLDNTGVVENPKPTWETRKQARTYQLNIPAPRGQITDRFGKPLAQNRLSYNLAISFPTPLDMSDQQVLTFAKQQITLASGILKRKIPIDEQALLTHYKNRGLLPYDIVEDLNPRELNVVSKGLTPNLILRQTYLRSYPHGRLAAHIIGYVGRVAPLSKRPIENGDLIFPDTEGRDGIEQVFNEQLQGIPGSLNVTFNADGKKMSERIAHPPVPGNNVITTLDLDLQRICEEVLQKNANRGAIVIIDPNNGEILAMASWPTFDPNLFVPVIKPDVFQALQKDPAVPLYPRAFRSAYPPGSTFKIVTGIAAFEQGVIEPDSRFDCPSTFSLGKFTWRNWKTDYAGKLTFVQALTQSCNTWFYQVGLQTGGDALVGWAQRLGFGKRTGIPLPAEDSGNIPTDSYMLKVHNRKILSGDVVNMSIGQGDILITPIQMAQAMGALATGGVAHQTRLVSQTQGIDNTVQSAYPDRIRDVFQLSPTTIQQLNTGLVSVTEDGSGTGHRAQVPGMHVAGKTGTAQWGPTNKQRTAAWFAGFLPANQPKFAFAAVYEGDPGVKVGGGSHAAPLIGKVFKEYYSLKAGAAKAVAVDEKEDQHPPDDPSAIDESN